MRHVFESIPTFIHIRYIVHTIMSDNQDVDIICSQTGVDDKDLVADVLANHNGDIVKAIMQINHLEPAPSRCSQVLELSDHEKHMEQIRAIVNEKEQLFFDIKEQQNCN